MWLNTQLSRRPDIYIEIVKTHCDHSCTMVKGEGIPHRRGIGRKEMKQER